jgi:DNA invertase Pin-like site-specific DNA recombinase
MLRCACYARFSSDLQRETSLEDQIATARCYAESHNWVILREHIYTDAATSGVSLERPGIQALLAAAAQRPLPFDVLLVDDSSRVARDLADAVRILQQLKFFGVRVLYLSQGIDSASEQAETLVAVHGMVDGLYLREVAAKVKRGLRGQLERGFATGGVTFGYRTVPVQDPSGRTDINGYPLLVGKRVEIIPEEARTVVHIFEWYASGLGTARILERLRREGHRAPRGRSWRDGAVKRILANEKYRGLLIWGKKTFDRRPGTKQLVERRLPRSQWHTQERPELRILSEELWTRVQARRRHVRQSLPEVTGGTLMRGRHAALYSRHLFAGFMRCGVCGGAVTIVTGGYGSPRYGCQMSWRQGVAVCTNRVTIRAKIVDERLLTALKAELIAPATVKYITDLLAKELNRRIDERPRLEAETRAAREEVEKRVQRLVEAIEHGIAPAAIAAAMNERQAELARLDCALAELAEPWHQRLAVMPAWVRQQLEDLVALLSDTPERTKAEFQRLSMRVTMTPVCEFEDRQPHYRADVVNSLPCLAGITDFRPIDVSAVDPSHPPIKP